MWLMTKHGFYSIVQKNPGEYHIRSHERRDLDNLVRGIPLFGATITETPKADYAFRIVTNAAVFLTILTFLGKTLNYPNFKAKIDSTPSQKHKPYHEVWRVMANALGTYGQRGHGR